MLLEKTGLSKGWGLAAAGSCNPGRAPHRGTVGCLNGADVSSGQRRAAHRELCSRFDHNVKHRQLQSGAIHPRHHHGWRSPAGAGDRLLPLPRRAVRDLVGVAVRPVLPGAPRQAEPRRDGRREEGRGNPALLRPPDLVLPTSAISVTGTSNSTHGSTATAAGPMLTSHPFPRSWPVS